MNLPLLPLLPSPSSSAAPANTGGVTRQHDLLQWRELLLQRLLGVALLAGAVPLLLSSLGALDSGQWRQPLIGMAALSAVAVLGYLPRMNYRLRAWGTVLLLYSMGLVLLVRVGPVTQNYLLACPVMAMLLLGTRSALVCLVAVSLTLGTAGWALDLPIHLPGFEHKPGEKWLNLGANLLFVGSLLTLSCGFLLRRLTHSLDDQHAVANSLRQSENNLSQIAAQVPGMVYRMRFDAQGTPQYLYASPGSMALFGVTPESLESDGRTVHRLVHPDDRARALADMVRADREGAALAMEFRVVLANGQEKWVQASSTEVARDAEGVVHNGIMVDITARKTAETLVWQQAHFDGLTGLPNRGTLRDRLSQAMATSCATGQPFALLLIDLDHFKEVNDTLGHDRGDELLVEAARRLRQCVRAQDTVARMGGDEFAVVLATVDDDQDAARLAQDMINTLGHAFQLGTECANVSASVGISLYGPDNVNDGMDDLLKHADLALYVAKDGGRNRYSHFTRVLQEQAQLRMRLATDLRHALDQRQFHVVYQPIVCLSTGQVVKAEALIRWEHPERGPISPAEFIPIAESTGLINEIGDWVFLTAARQAKAWRRSLHPQFQISVNRSPVQFRSSTNKQLSWGQQLAQLGVSGDAIAVEITEGLLLDNGPGVSAQLRALRDAGLPISLDDFGTGYSAMAYLQKFTLDYLKIDRSFVNGIGQDASSRALCQAIVVMAHALGMKVVAEGIETQAQYDWLRDAGCDYGQGFLLSRPLKPEAFEAFVGRAPASSTAASPVSKAPAARSTPAQSVCIS